MSKKAICESPDFYVVTVALTTYLGKSAGDECVGEEHYGKYHHKKN